MPSLPPKGTASTGFSAAMNLAGGRKTGLGGNVSFHRIFLNTSFKIIFPHLPQYWHKGKAPSFGLEKRRGSESLLIVWCL